MDRLYENTDFKLKRKIWNILIQKTKSFSTEIFYFDKNKQIKI